MTSIFTETPLAIMIYVTMQYSHSHALSEEKLIQYLCTSVVQTNKSVSLSLI